MFPADDLARPTRLRRRHTVPAQRQGGEGGRGENRRTADERVFAAAPLAVLPPPRRLLWTTDDPLGLQLVARQRARGHGRDFQANAQVDAEGFADGDGGGRVLDLDEHA